MNAVFADTSYWYGLLIRTDQWHEAAVRAQAGIGDRRIVTTEMVLTELLNSVSRLGAQQRATVSAMVRRLYANPNVTVVRQTGAQFGAALAYYEARLDKRWGQTDCASFLVMFENGITHALTADRDFAQSGFTALM